MTTRRSKDIPANFQECLMVVDPATGHKRPYPSHARQWRWYHGEHTAWLFNPWSTKRRLAQDVGSDPFGHLIVAEGQP